jgi:hypothetical protein
MRSSKFQTNPKFTKEFISKASLLKNLPTPLFSKEGYITSLWQREVRRDFMINVFILMTLLVNGLHMSIVYDLGFRN